MSGLPEIPADQTVACNECARAVALGWWGGIARHPEHEGAVCLLCGEGEAVHTAQEWFGVTVMLRAERARDGQHRTWREDAAAGLGITKPGQ